MNVVLTVKQAREQQPMKVFQYQNADLAERFTFKSKEEKVQFHSEPWTEV